MRSLLSTTLIVLLGAALAGCGSKRSEKPRTGPLIERVGDQQGIQALVDDFAKQVAQNEDLAPKFAKVDMAAFRTSFSGQICAAVGGKCAYDGNSKLAEVGLDEDEFEIMLEVLIVSMNNVKLPQQEQNDLIDALVELQPEVVAAAEENQAAEGEAGEGEAGEGEAGEGASAGGDEAAIDEDPEAAGDPAAEPGKAAKPAAGAN